MQDSEKADLSDIADGQWSGWKNIQLLFLPRSQPCFLLVAFRMNLRQRLGWSMLHDLLSVCGSLAADTMRTFSDFE